MAQNVLELILAIEQHSHRERRFELRFGIFMPASFDAIVLVFRYCYFIGRDHLH